MDVDNALTYRIIGCGMEVHRRLGPGLSESNYEEALCIELTSAGLNYVRQVGVPVLYKEQQIGEHRPDLVVENGVVVEIKSVDRLIGVHRSQTHLHADSASAAWFDPELQRRSVTHRHCETQNLNSYLCASVPPCVVCTRSQCRVLPGDQR
jgi:GxxExxY protein